VIAAGILDDRYVELIRGEIVKMLPEGKPMVSFVDDRSHPVCVVVYTDAMGIGGAEISLGHLVATASSHLDITVVGVSQLVVNAIADRRSQATRVVLAERGIRAFLSHLLTFWRLRPDVIHVNLCTPWAGAIGLTAALLLPQVRVVRVDQLPLRTTDAVALWRTRALCLRVDVHVAVGQASARRMEDFYALGRNTVRSIPNGVPDFESPLSPSVALDQPVLLDHLQLDRPMIVGSIGRLDAMKGHDVLLRAIAQVEGIRAVILGEGDQRLALETLAVELGVSDRVELRGWVDHPRAYLPGFDVVALPSRSEGFPLAMVEAMLAARPVIATRVGSMPEAVIDRQTGILIEKDDVLGLAEALRYLRNDPVQRIFLGKQARELALSHFTVTSMTQAYERIWYDQSPRNSRLWVSRPLD
jgi:glycosyltransferase involved in cell wall biosynthesis